jgi:hypothetical protein
MVNIKRCAQTCPECSECRVLRSEKLFVNKHLEVLVNLAIPPGVLLKLHPSRLQSFQLPPQLVKARLPIESSFLSTMYKLLAFLTDEPLVRKVLIQKFPAGLRVKRCVQNTPPCAGLSQVLCHCLRFTIRHNVAPCSLGRFLNEAEDNPFVTPLRFDIPQMQFDKVNKHFFVWPSKLLLID